TVASVGPYSLRISTPVPKLASTLRASSVVSASPPTIRRRTPLARWSSSTSSARWLGVSFNTSTSPLRTASNTAGAPSRPWYTTTRLPLTSGGYSDVTVRSNDSDEHSANDNRSPRTYCSSAQQT